MTELYNLEQMEEKLGISNRTLSRYLADGELTGIKIGREWRFTDEDIEKFLSTRRRKTEQDRLKRKRST